MRFLLLAFAFLMLAVPARAQQGCVSYPNVPVHITPVFDEPRADFTRNLATIQQIARGANTIPHHEAVTLGVTSYKRVLAFNIPMEITQYPGELACAYVKEVNVRVGYQDLIVFIASEIPQNSCGFEQTMLHEQKHVAVDYDLLKEYIPFMTEKLKEYLRINGVFRVAQPDYAEHLLREKLDAVMNDLIAVMEVENTRRQQEVDSPAEYARLSRVCQGQLARIAGNFRNGR